MFVKNIIFSEKILSTKFFLYFQCSHLGVTVIIVKTWCRIDRNLNYSVKVAKDRRNLVMKRKYIFRNSVGLAGMTVQDSMSNELNNATVIESLVS